MSVSHKFCVSCRQSSQKEMEVVNSTVHAVNEYLTKVTEASGLSLPIIASAILLALTLLYIAAASRPRFKLGPPPSASPAQTPEPVQVGKISPEDLLAYDGSDANKPLLMAIKGQVYDVSRSRNFYGPGGAYAAFAGRDASQALAKMSFEPQHVSPDVSGLTQSERDTLEDWELRFHEKYPVVGTVAADPPAAPASS